MLTRCRRYFSAVALFLPLVGGSPLAAQPPTGLAPGDIVIADYLAGANGNGLLFWVNRTTGARLFSPTSTTPARGRSAPAPTVSPSPIETPSSSSTVLRSMGAGSSSRWIR